jgi:hypothetical protein
MISMDEKYVREVCWMRNMDAKDGLQVMMDEKYGCKGWFASYDR